MHCICCESTKITSLGKLKSYDYNECNQCGFKFIYPLPTQQELTDFYNKTRVNIDLKQTVKKLITEFDQSPSNPKKDWFHIVLKNVQQICKKEKLSILELGSGYGYFIHEMTNKGQQVIGTESTKEYAEAVSEVINGKIEFIDQPLIQQYGKEQFDFVYLEHVFEHVLSPEKLLAEIKEVMKQDGVLVLSVPNTSSLFSKLMGKKWPWATPPDHLYYYNLKSITTLLSKHNLKVVNSSTGDYYFRSIYQMYSIMPIINFIRKRLKKKTINNPYTYPNNIFSIFVLFPYWIIYPILKLIKNSGNELTVYCIKTKK
jgi:2-polyprenyl-3-methyl-5-hydroxy-6-metoxy-1,4-benzoquinol methylase